LKKAAKNAWTETTVAGLNVKGARDRIDYRCSTSYGAEKLTT